MIDITYSFFTYILIQTRSLKFSYYQFQQRDNVLNVTLRLVPATIAAADKQ